MDGSDDFGFRSIEVDKVDFHRCWRVVRFVDCARCRGPSQGLSYALIVPLIE